MRAHLGDNPSGSNNLALQKTIASAAVSLHRAGGKVYIPFCLAGPAVACFDEFGCKRAIASLDENPRRSDLTY